MESWFITPARHIRRRFHRFVERGTRRGIDAVRLALFRLTPWGNWRKELDKLHSLNMTHAATLTKAPWPAEFHATKNTGKLPGWSLLRRTVGTGAAILISV